MYYSTDKKEIDINSQEQVISAYNQGYVLTRIGRGIVNQTRSVRIDLNEFELNSENRRVLKQTGELLLLLEEIPFEKESFDWNIQKIAKEFYATKFGKETFSVSKINEVLTNREESNFNRLIRFHQNSKTKGYSIIYLNNEIMHYAYPFYDLTQTINNLGMSMMIHTILYAKSLGIAHMYLGSATRSSDKYKLQFKGLEWYEDGKWNSDIDQLKSKLINL